MTALDALLARVRSLTPEDMVGVVLDAREVLLGGDNWGEAAQAAMDAAPHDNTYDDAGNALWDAAKETVTRTVEAMAEEDANDGDTREVTWWRAARPYPPPTSGIATVPVASLIAWQYIYDAVREAALHTMQDVLHHAGGAATVRGAISPEQYATLTGWLLP
ncbi:hypothetical protein [Streptomyces olivaceoviridis]|uniref:hypothetical protein n=1 Tax=Streptomyces olivaceoviridis TaxID=1921 RepID=UPI00332DFA64